MLTTKPIPTETELTSTFTVSAVLDKGSGQVVLVDVVSREKATGDPVFRNQLSVFVVGSGGFGGPRESDKAVRPAKIPARNPDLIREYTTSIDQVGKNLI